MAAQTLVTFTLGLVIPASLAHVCRHCRRWGRCGPELVGASPARCARTPRKASATGEDAKSLVDRAAPIAVVQKNPKRGASGERFDKYMAATTAAEFLELGGTRADLKYDIARGWVTVLDRAPPPAQVPARGKKGQARPRVGSDDAVYRGYPG